MLRSVILLLMVHTCLLFLGSSKRLFGTLVGSMFTLGLMNESLYEGVMSVSSGSDGYRRAFSFDLHYTGLTKKNTFPTFSKSRFWT